MKKYLLALLPVLGGIAAFILRMLQLRTGFETSTGLPVAGNPYAYGLVVLLVVLAVVFFLLVRRLPAEKTQPPSFQDAFSAFGAGGATLLVVGVFLLAVSGVYDIYSGLVAAPSRATMVMGILSILSAVCLFPVIPVCRRKTADAEAAPRTLSGGYLLVPVCCFVVRLILVYRQDSLNPSLAAYYVELLALTFLSLALYRLSSFAYGAGRTRRFAMYAMMAIVLCAATLAERAGLSSMLLYAGGAVLLLGFLLLRLEALAIPQDRT